MKRDCSRGVAGRVVARAQKIARRTAYHPAEIDIGRGFLMNLVRIVALVVFVNAFVAVAVAQTPIGTQLSYQGRLDSNGLPADGVFDMRFRLYSSATSGTQVGPTVCRDQVVVADGLFTVPLDFGQQFTGDARFIEISVREDATSGNCSTGLFTVLGPRQPITPTPYALMAVGPWTKATDGSLSYAAGDIGVGVTSPQARLHVVGASAGGNSLDVNGKLVVNDAGEFVGVNRPEATFIGEYFGVRAPITDGLGGMMLHVDSSNASGFYGYYNGTSLALTYMDGFTGDWRVLVGDGDKMVITQTGLVGIGSPNPGSVLEVLGDGTSTGVVTAAQLSGDANGGAVYGLSTVANANGVIGQVDSGSQAAAIWGIANAGWAAWLQGNVRVTGTLTKGGGSFQIDHPLDPDNKYLFHSFVESPDMKNIYDGVVETDDRGYARIEMPAWFEKINRDFRYQLTVIDVADADEFILAKIVRELSDNKFTIRTSRPNVRVSWQVTGIRCDAFANAHRIQVEVDKPPAERGLFLYPAEIGQPAERGVDNQRRKQLRPPTQSTSTRGACLEPK
ncbi:MAG: hypothetical protein JNG88_12645 [Phycisphaerales bacterium]|nr:hypothetical protein [Phycisphaerales bacterium]